MKPAIFNIAILSFLALCSPAYAGIGACHDGQGNVTSLSLDANPAAFTGENCAYYKDAEYDRIFAKIGKVDRRYVKWGNAEPVEMAPAEKVAVDDAIAASLDAEIDARLDREPSMKDVRDQAAQALTDIDEYLLIADSATNAQVRAFVKKLAQIEKKEIKMLERLVRREYR